LLDRRTIGERLRRRREDLKLSQKEVADALGVSRVSLSNWERGERELGISDIISLAAALEIPVSSLLGEQFNDRSAAAFHERFDDEDAAIWYNGLPPTLKPAARAALKALYDQADVETRRRRELQK
jgi:transcriptional regulator with XRE-family HTH domain